MVKFAPTAASSFNFNFLQPLLPLTNALPSSVAGSKRAPALLKIFHALSLYPSTLPIVSGRSDVVQTVIRCVATPRAAPEVMRVVVEVLNHLLDFEGGRSIYPHSEVGYRYRYLHTDSDKYYTSQYALLSIYYFCVLYIMSFFRIEFIHLHPLN